MRHAVFVTRDRERFDLEGYELMRAEVLTDAVADGADCVIIAAADPATVAAAFTVAQPRETASAAVLLAGAATDLRVNAALAAHPFDGFVDLAWPRSLQRAAVERAVAQVLVGRNVVEIQRAVIEQSLNESVSLYELAVRDELTTLNNKRHFDEILAREHERSKRLERPYAIVYVDLDDLKQLNTRYGHDGGSAALRALGRVLASLCRVSDAPARVGGDEFAVLVADTDKRGGRDFAARLQAELARVRIDVGGERIGISASIGVAAFPEDAECQWDVVQHADLAVLQAKARGKRRVVAYEAGWPAT